MDYQCRVRDRTVQCTEHAESQRDRKLARALWLAFEHEAMHLETFLYMLLQSEKVLPPPDGGNHLDLKAQALRAAEARIPNTWNHIPAAKVTLGLDDPENDLGPDRYFGWDNERPARHVNVGAFEAQTRPISNGEYARFLELTNKERLPASWTTLTSKAGKPSPVAWHHQKGDTVASPTFVAGKGLRTVYGIVPLAYALDWPVMASYDELAAFAAWSGGRIPTLEEVRSIYAYVELQKQAELEKVPSTLISAVNGYVFSSLVHMGQNCG